MLFELVYTKTEAIPEAEASLESWYYGYYGHPYRYYGRGRYYRGYYGYPYRYWWKREAEAEVPQACQSGPIPAAEAKADPDPDEIFTLTLSLKVSLTFT